MSGGRSNSSQKNRKRNHYDDYQDDYHQMGHPQMGMHGQPPPMSMGMAPDTMYYQHALLRQRPLVDARHEPRADH